MQEKSEAHKKLRRLVVIPDMCSYCYEKVIKNSRGHHTCREMMNAFYGGRLKEEQTYQE